MHRDHHLSSLPARYRYRLYEFMEPANDLKLYNLTSGNSAYNGKGLVPSEPQGKSTAPSMPWPTT